MSTPNERLEAALAYRKLGLLVLPLNGKDPHHALIAKMCDGKSSTGHYARHARPSEADLRMWFEVHPEVNIGLVLSRFGTTGAVVVDLDPNKRDESGEYKLSPDVRQALLDRQGFDYTPLMVTTGSGGWHLYYERPTAGIPLVTQAGHDRGPGVDIIADGARYVVAPPSVHPQTGETYRWYDEERARPIDLAQVLSEDRLQRLPECPDWLVEKTAFESSQYERQKREYGWVSRALESVRYEGGRNGESGRNVMLRSLAQFFAAKTGVQEDICVELMQNWNLTRCRPALKHGEVTRQVRNSYEHVTKDRTRRSQLLGEIGDQVILRQTGPKFPLALLDRVPVIRDWVYALMHSRGVSPDLAASSAIAGLAVASTGKYRIRWMKGRAPTDSPDSVTWTIPTNMWFTIIAESGSRKSVPFEIIDKALGQYSDPLDTIAHKFNTALDTRREVLTIAKRRAAQEMDRSHGEVQRIYQEHHARICRMLADLPTPMSAGWRLTDTTPEALLKRLQHVGSVALLSPECAEIFKGFFGHYSGNADISGIMKTWAGENIEVTRITRDDVSIKNGTTSIFALGQASILYGMDEKGDADDRGFNARMLYAIPHARVCQQSQDPHDLARAADAESRFAQRLRDIFWGGLESYNWVADYARTAQFKPIACEDDDTPELPEEDEGKKKKGFKPPPSEVLVKPELRPPVDILALGEVIDIVSSFEDRMREQAQPGKPLWSVRGWIGKIHEHALRMAAVLQLAEDPPRASEPATYGEFGPEPPRVGPIELRREYVELAIELIETYYLPHQRVARDIMSRPKQTEAAINAMIRFSSEEWGKPTFALSDLADAAGTSMETAKDLALWMETVGALWIDKARRNWECKPQPGILY